MSFFHLTTRIDHDHPSVWDMSAFHSFRQMFVIQRSRRTCTSRFLREYNSSHHSDERYDVWNRSNPWCTRSALEFLPPLVCHLQCKATHFHHCHSACVSNNSWIDHTYPWNYHRIQVTEWFRRHWERISTILPVSSIFLHSERMPCCRKCPLLPRFRELSPRIPCARQVVSTTCYTRLHHPSYDLQWSYARLHWQV